MQVSKEDLLQNASRSQTYTRNAKQIQSRVSSQSTVNIAQNSAVEANQLNNLKEITGLIIEPA